MSDPTTTSSGPAMASTPDDGDSKVSTGRLALILGASIIGLLGLLTWLAPLGVPVASAELQRLLQAEQVVAIDVGTTAIVAFLEESQLVQQLEGGRLAQAQSIRIYRSLVDEAQLDSLRQTGIPVRQRSSTTDGALGPYTWIVVVLLLLAAGGWHLVDQARRHRLHGSPRQQIADLERELEQGKIDPDRFRREVEQLSTEL